MTEAKVFIPLRKGDVEVVIMALRLYEKVTDDRSLKEKISGIIEEISKAIGEV
ncbi:MAG: hypothetical protein NDF55_09705 [archaeon GB-1867-005]|nr:hypothetical protein [Candidatus Culexmicrobium cathedralense]